MFLAMRANLHPAETGAGRWCLFYFSGACRVSGSMDFRSSFDLLENHKMHLKINLQVRTILLLLDQKDEEISVLRRNVCQMEGEWQYFEHGWARGKKYVLLQIDHGILRHQWHSYLFIMMYRCKSKSDWFPRIATLQAIRRHNQIEQLELIERCSTSGTHKQTALVPRCQYKCSTVWD